MRGVHASAVATASVVNTPASLLYCHSFSPSGVRALQVIDDLDEIHFTMKKARQVLRDMTRSLMTDK